MLHQMRLESASLSGQPVSIFFFLVFRTLSAFLFTFKSTTQRSSFFCSSLASSSQSFSFQRFAKSQAIALPPPLLLAPLHSRPPAPLAFPRPAPPPASHHLSLASTSPPPRTRSSSRTRLNPAAGRKSKKLRTKQPGEGMRKKRFKIVKH